jgi:2-dehydropantoate 2-reductase
MRICVFSASSVGGYLAGFLAQGWADLSVVARGAHLAAIRADDLHVETPDGSIAAHLPASDDPRELGSQDAVIVAGTSHLRPARWLPVRSRLRKFGAR